MGWPVQPLLFFLARCTRNQLIRQIEFLKAENEMLRKRVPKQRIWVKPDERERLLKIGLPLGPDLKHLITIVTYDAFRRWRRAACGFVARGPKGRPKKPAEIRELVVKIARETGWGYTRILGELRKLGVKDISRQTIVNILKEAGQNPYSSKGPGSWDELIKRHADTLWQCDFFSKRVLSRLGFPQLFAMVFLNVATRRVWVSPATGNPTEAWVVEQAKAFIDYTEDNGLKVDLVTRDNDQIYKKRFDCVMEGAGTVPDRRNENPVADTHNGSACKLNVSASLEHVGGRVFVEIDCYSVTNFFGNSHVMGIR
jgi:putative transposase